MEFEIGDYVWLAKTEWKEDKLPCPHCFGKKFLTVILGNDERVTIDCECCRQGYLGSQGTLAVGQYRADVSFERITRKEQRAGEDVNYSVGGYSIKQNDIFILKEDAQARASEMASDNRADEMRRFYAKENSARTWAWNATYHRNNVKRLKQELAYHESKLDVAKSAVTSTKTQNY